MKNLLLFSFLLSTVHIYSQPYTEISIDTTEHFNIAMQPTETYYFSTLSGCNGNPSIALLNFTDPEGNILDFVDITIDHVLPAAITPNITIYAILFQMKLKNNAPPPGSMEDASMVSLFLNSSGTLIGGYIRSNMSLTIEGASASIYVDRSHSTLSVYPNPTSDIATFRFALNQSAKVHLSLFDPNGKFVGTLANSTYPPGEHEVSMNLRSISAQPLPNGIYLCRMEVNDRTRLVRLAITSP